ncbi:MAG TPA: tetratricopeptide repeat protein [Bryobacteraceae bacterium]|jgi:tetratricopeptide (TPR) repeat protein
MRLLCILLVGTGLSFADADTPHIKAAASAYQQAKAALLKKDTAAAVELLVKAIQIEPTFLDAYKQLIEARIASGDRLEAAAVITRFLEIEPEASHYRLLLAQILLAQQQWNRALAQFSIVLKDDPFNADALFGFATAAKRLGMQDRASEALSRGRDRYPFDKRFR